MGSRHMTRSDAGMATSRFIDIKAPRIRHQASCLSRALTILSMRVMFGVISLQAMSTSEADVTVEVLSPTELPSSSESTRPDPCTSPVSGVSIIREEFYHFSGKYFWRVKKNGGLEEGHPIPISMFWYALPTDVAQLDAVYERTRNGNFVFFKDSTYWELDSNTPKRNLSRQGKPLTDLGLPASVSRIDAAFVWSVDNRAYLVSDDVYWKMDRSRLMLDNDTSYPKRLNETWSNLPTHPDAAFTDLDGNLNFVKGDLYWQVVGASGRLTDDLPRKRNESWMFGCVGRSMPSSAAISYSIGCCRMTPGLGLLKTIILTCVLFIRQVAVICRIAG